MSRRTQVDTSSDPPVLVDPAGVYVILRIIARLGRGGLVTDRSAWGDALVGWRNLGEG